MSQKIQVDRVPESRGAGYHDIPELSGSTVPSKPERQYPPEGLSRLERMVLAIRNRLPRVLGGHRMVNNLRPSLWARVSGGLGRREWGGVAVLLIIGVFFLGPFYERWASDQISKPDVDRFLAMSESDYDSLPIAWKNLLAGVAARPESYSEGLVEALRHISPSEASRIDLFAPYVVDDFILIHAGSDLQSFPEFAVDEKALSELSELEALGIVAEGSFGRMGRLPPSADPRFASQLVGTSLGLAILETGSKETYVGGFEVTDLGLELFRLVSSPTDGPLMQWLAQTLTSEGYHAEVWSVRPDEMGMPQLVAPLGVDSLAP